MIHRRTRQRWLLVRQVLLVLGEVVAVVLPVAVSREVGLTAERSRSR